MKEKLTTAQKVAQLNQQQKSDMLKYGILADAIVLVLVLAAIVFFLPGFQEVKALRDEAAKISDAISEQNDLILEEIDRTGDLDLELIPYDEAYEVWDEVDEANRILLTNFVVVFSVITVIWAILFVFLKKKCPYYSEGAFFYLLFGRDKKPVQ